MIDFFSFFFRISLAAARIRCYVWAEEMNTKAGRRLPLDTKNWSWSASSE
jgi:hypothetical protein